MKRLEVTFIFDFLTRLNFEIMTTYEVSGTVVPGYEPVRETFKRNFELGREKNAQCCVYVKGEKVSHPIQFP